MPEPVATEDGLDSALREAEDLHTTHADHVLTAVEDRLFPGTHDPKRLGRYRIIERLGEGGMGVVFRAHDPQLDREVAIKQVHRHMARNEAARARLSREARALAEVSHPNVVEIYDVGEEDGAVYIGMELVPGIDLRQWIEQERRTWSEVLTMFVAAGRGLAAAHDRGLVHRDFKPANVLVGPDDRPRVVDFGLACVADVVPTANAAPTGEVPSSSLALDSGPLTKTGTTMGTPAYMAPEQHRGEAADARSDQYAFCLSLFEGLYGVRPFRGRDMKALAAAKHRDSLPDPPSHAVPARLHAVLQRGLWPRPEDRWPSMAALLTALDRATRPRLRMGWRAGTVVLATGGLLAAGAVASFGDDAVPSACPPSAERLAGIWDEPRAAALRQAIQSSRQAYADQTWARLDQRLGRYAEGWGQAYDGVCRQLHQGSADPAAVDRRMACLGSRRDELGSLVDVLTSAEGQAVRNAVQASYELRPVADCHDSPAPNATESAGDDAAEQLGRELLQAHTLGRVARFDDALALAEPAIERAAALGLSALQAEAQLIAGQMHKGKGNIAKAEARLSEAALLAASNGRDDLAARAAVSLVDVRGAWQSRHDEALEWSRHAQASIERLGDAPQLEARRLAAVGHLEQASGAFDAAIEAFERALALDLEHLGAGHPYVASDRSNLGGALVRAGRFDEGLKATQQALAAGQQAFGEGHPEVGIMHGRLGNAWFRQADYERAIIHHEQAIEILENALGRDHANVLAIVANLAQALHRQGRLHQAEAAYERALAGVRGTPNEAIVRAALADLARERSDYPAALEHARRSREIRESLFGDDNPMVLTGLLYEGLALAQAGHDEQALANFERVRDATEPTSLSLPLQVLQAAYEARAHLYAGRPEPARQGLRHALALQEKLGAEPLDRADVRFHLVQALWALGQHDQARTELAEVDRTLAPLGPQVEYRREPIRAWIAQHEVGYELSVPKHGP